MPKDADAQNEIKEEKKHYDDPLTSEQKIEDAFVCNERGIELYNLGRYAEALEYFEKALCLNASIIDTNCYYNMAHALYRLGRYKEALTCLQEIIKIEPTSIEAHNALAHVLASMGQNEQALLCYEQSFILLNDQHSQIEFAIATYNGKGYALCNLQRYEEAFHCYEEALKLSPTVASHCGQGEILFFRKKFSVSLAAFEEALRLNNKYVLALLGKANALLQLKQYKKALTCFADLLQLQPDDALLREMAKIRKRIPYYFLPQQGIIVLTKIKEGNQLYRKGHFHEALISFNTALENDHELEDAHIGIGFVLFKSGQLQEALELFDGIIRKNSKSVRAWKGVALVYYSQGNYSKALACFRQITQLRPTSIFALNGIILCHGKLHEYKQALNYFQNAHDIKLSAKTYCSMGDIFYCQDQYAKALEYYDEALKLDQQDAHAHNGRANVLFQLSNYKNALIEFEAALKSPSKASVLKELEKIQQLKPAYLSPSDGKKEISAHLVSIARNHKKEGDQYYIQKKYPEAIASYNAAVDLAGKDFFVCTALANIFLECENYLLALDFFNQALNEYKPNDKDLAEISKIPGFLLPFRGQGRVSAKLKVLAEETNQIGESYFAAKDFVAALTHYKKAFDFFPDDFDICKNNGLAHYYLEHDQEALDFLESALKLNSESYIVYYTKGKILNKLGHKADAVVCFEKCLNLKESVEICKILANLLAEINQYDKALVFYERVLKLLESYRTLVTYRLEFATIYRAKADVHVCKAEYQHAAVCYEKVLQYSPSYSGYCLWGEALFYNKEFAKALESFEQALNPSLKYLPALLGKANALLQLEKHQDAFDFFAIADELKPEEGLTAHWNKIQQRTSLYYLPDEGKKKAAILLATKYRTEADRHFVEGKYTEALRDYKKALKYNPSCLLSKNGLGNVLIQLERYVAALEYFEETPQGPTPIEFSELQKQNPFYLFPDQARAKLLGIKYTQEGTQFYLLNDYKNALESYAQAFDLDANNSAACNGKANALLKLGQLQEALDCFNRALEFKAEQSTLTKFTPLQESKEVDYLFPTQGKEQVIRLLLEKYITEGERHSQQNRLQEALEWIDKALGLNAKDPEAHRAKIRMLYTHKQYEKAFALCHKIEIGSFPAINCEAEMLYYFDEYERALTAHQAAFKRDSKNLYACNGLANAYLKIVAAKPNMDSSQSAEFLLLAQQCFENAIQLSSTAVLTALPIINAHNYDYLLPAAGKSEAINRLVDVARKFCERGDEFLMRLDSDKAIAFYDQAIKCNPQSLEAYSGKALAFYKKKDYRQALDLYNKALSYDPSFMVANIGKGNCLYKEGRHGDALTCYEKVISRDHQNAYVLNCIANLYLKSGRHEEALTTFKEVKKILTSAANYLIARAIEEKIAEMEELNPGYLQSDKGIENISALLEAKYIAIANKHYSTCEYQQALENYNKAIEFNPLSSLARNGKANALLQLGQNQEATHAFREASTLDAKPFQEAAFGAWQKQNRQYLLPEDGEKIALKCLREQATECYKKGEGCYRLSQYELAEQHYSRAICLWPDYIEAHYGKGLAYYHLDRYREALLCFEEVVKQDPNHVFAQYYVGFCCYVNRDYYQAYIAYQKTLLVKLENYKGTEKSIIQDLKKEICVLAFNGLANTLFKCARREEAFNYFELAKKYSLSSSMKLKIAAEQQPLLMQLRTIKTKMQDKNLSYFLPEEGISQIFPPGSNLLTRRSLKKLVDGNNEDMQIFYSNAIKLVPGSVYVFCDLGNVFYKLRRYEQSWECYLQAEFLDPNCELAQKGSAQAYHEVQKVPMKVKDVEPKRNAREIPISSRPAPRKKTDPSVDTPPSIPLESEESKFADEINDAVTALEQEMLEVNQLSYHFSRLINNAAENSQTRDEPPRPELPSLPEIKDVEYKVASPKAAMPTVIAPQTTVTAISIIASQRIIASTTDILKKAIAKLETLIAENKLGEARKYLERFFASAMHISLKKNPLEAIKLLAPLKKVADYLFERSEIETLKELYKQAEKYFIECELPFYQQFCNEISEWFAQHPEGHYKQERFYHLAAHYCTQALWALQKQSMNELSEIKAFSSAMAAQNSRLQQHMTLALAQTVTDYLLTLLTNSSFTQHFVRLVPLLKLLKKQNQIIVLKSLCLKLNEHYKTLLENALDESIRPQNGKTTTLKSEAEITNDCVDRLKATVAEMDKFIRAQAPWGFGTEYQKYYECVLDCAKKFDQKRLEAKADQILKDKWQQCYHEWFDKTTKSIDIVDEAKDTETQADGNSHYSHLATARSRLREQMPDITDPALLEVADLKQIQTAQDVFTKTICELLVDFLKQANEYLGESPCPFAILGLGSLSRSGFCPASDIDIAILLDTKMSEYREHPFFTALIHILNIQLLYLGDGHLEIDPADFPNLLNSHGAYVDTPEGFLKRYHPKRIAGEKNGFDGSDAYALHQASFLFPEEPKALALWANYQQQLKTLLTSTNKEEIDREVKNPISHPWHQLLAKGYALAHQKQLNTEMKNMDSKDVVNLKIRYLAPLTWWCLDLAFYYGKITGMPTENTKINIPLILTQLAEDKRVPLSADFFALVKQAWGYLQILRISKQQEWLPQAWKLDKSTRDIFYLPTALAKDSCLTLTTEQAKALQYIDETILQPCYTNKHPLIIMDIKASEEQIASQPTKVNKHHKRASLDQAKLIGRPGGSPIVRNASIRDIEIPVLTKEFIATQKIPLQRYNELKQAQEIAEQKAAIIQPLQKIAQERGLRLHDVKDDGNCQFHAIAHQLSLLHDELEKEGKIGLAMLNHADLRIRVVNTIRRNKASFSPYVPNENIETYITRMDRDGEYGDQLTLLALSQYLKVNIELTHPAGNIVRFPDIPNPESLTLRLGYNGHHHYYSLVPVMAPAAVPEMKLVLTIL